MNVLLLAALLAQDALVTTDWVHENTGSPKVRILDVSVDPGVFEKGHVLGSVGVKWHSELADPVKRDVVSKEAFEKNCSRWGITRETTVVLYGDNNNWFAAWGYWIFATYGHPSIKLMDGGRVKWELEKRPWAVSVTPHAATTYVATAPATTLRARLADVSAAVEKGSAVLVDVRSPDEFSGKIIAPPGALELAIRAGRIPGAKNVPWKSAVKEDGTFKSVDDLKKIYATAGADGSKPVIAYCRIGERSSHSWFVLKVLLGYADVRNYDGSWTEYGNSVGLPIENEAGTVWTGK